MKAAMRVFLLLGVTIGLVYGAAVRKSSNLPAWVECTSNLDCAPGYCCTIAHEKYSYPRCQRLHEEGEFCRPGDPLMTNGSRYYPDNTEIELDNIYLMFCPCSLGLTCDRVDAVCRNASDMTDFNHITTGYANKND